MCFFGPQQCDLPGWSRIGRYELVEPSAAPAPVVSRRRLLQTAAGVEDQEQQQQQLTAAELEEAEVAGVVRSARRLQQQAQSTPKDAVVVTIVWGIRAARDTPLVGPIEEPWSFDPTFEPDNPWAQRAIYRMCTDHPKNIRLFEASCWITDFRKALLAGGKKFPSRNFTEDILEWYASAEAKFTKQVFMVKGTMKACTSDFTVFAKNSAQSSYVLEYQKYWDSFLTSRNEASSVTANRAWHSAQVWVRAEAQSAIVSSTLNTILIECFCGWLGITMFTGNPGLAVLVLGLVLMNISGLAFFMVYIMEWAMGPIEIIFLVVFLGYSVTYGLHIANNYVEASEDDPQLQEAEQNARKRSSARNASSAYSNETATSSSSAAGVEDSAADMDLEVFGSLVFTDFGLRKARARLAVLHVGSAILSSTISTVGSSLFLLLCTMTLFKKLGLIVITVTVLSIGFTLVALPAVLMLCGPPEVPCLARHSNNLIAFIKKRMSHDSAYQEA
jgi:hypothetical protein